MLKYIMLFGSIWYATDLFFLLFENRLPDSYTIGCTLAISIIVLAKSFFSLLSVERLTAKIQPEIDKINADNTLTSKQKSDKIQEILKNQFLGGK